MAFKLHTIGGFKAVKNDPTTVADVALIQGQPVVLDKQAGKSKLPVLAEAKGKELHVVANIDDQPSLFAKEDVAVAKDAHVRAFRLADLQGLEIELGGKALAEEARVKVTNSSLTSLVFGRKLLTLLAMLYISKLQH